MANSCCPVCGGKVTNHNLQNENVGVWCDSCLSGIPDTDLGTTDDVDSAEILYDIWRSRIIKGSSISGKFE